MSCGASTGTAQTQFQTQSGTERHWWGRIGNGLTRENAQSQALGQRQLCLRIRRSGVRILPGAPHDSPAPVEASSLVSTPITGR